MQEDVGPATARSPSPVRSRRWRPLARPAIGAVLLIATVGIGARWGPRAEKRAVPPSTDTWAHSVLAGEQLASRYRERDLGLALLDRAIRNAPTYAPAHVAKAKALYEGKWDNRPLSDTIRGIERHAARAMTLIPRAPEPLIYLGATALRFRMDTGSAESLLRQASALDPEDATARRALAWLYLATARPQQAIDNLLEARRLGGADAVAESDLAYAYLHGGDLEAALAHAEAGFRHSPNTLHAPWVLFEVRMARGEPAEALEVGNIYSVLAGWPESDSLDAWHERILARFRWSEDHKYRWWGSEIALLEDRLGRRREALATLEAACQRRSGWSLAFVRSDPRFAALRADPGFEATRSCLETPIRETPFP